MLLMMRCRLTPTWLQACGLNQLPMRLRLSQTIRGWFEKTACSMRSFFGSCSKTILFPRAITGQAFWRIEIAAVWIEARTRKPAIAQAIRTMLFTRLQPDFDIQHATSFHFYLPVDCAETRPAGTWSPAALKCRLVLRIECRIECSLGRAVFTTRPACSTNSCCWQYQSEVGPDSAR